MRTSQAEIPLPQQEPEFTVLSVEEISCEFPENNPLADSLALWRLWAGDRAAPTWRDVELFNLPPIIVPQTLVVDTIDGGRDFRYRFWGSAYTDNYGLDESGKLLSETLGPRFVEVTFLQLHDVIKSGKPRAYDVAIRAPYSGVVQTKINLRVPIMDEPDTVTKVITLSMFNETTRKDVERLRVAYGDDLKRRTGDGN